MYTLCK